MVLKGTAAPVSPEEAATMARSDARRSQLLEAAARLMERSGSHSVSMQAVADEAGVSVGLIYRYFPSKDDLVQGVIVGVLDEMARPLPAALGPEADPVRRIAEVFSAYCSVIRDNREAVLLTYRESRGLDEAGRRLIKDLEVQTAQPLVEAVRSALDAGLLRPVRVEVFAYRLLVAAHSWALKHWYYARLLSFEDFVADEIALALSAVLAPDHRADYADLLGDYA